MYSLHSFRCPLVSINLSQQVSLFLEYLQTINIPNEVVIKPSTTFALFCKANFSRWQLFIELTLSLIDLLFTSDCAS